MVYGAGFGDVGFSWTFSDEDVAGESGNGLTELTRYYYGEVSNERWDKEGYLTISWGNGSLVLIDSYTKPFTLGQCINNGNTYLEITAGGVVEHDTWNSSLNCEDTDCCYSEDYYCDYNNSLRCELKSIYDCASYESQGDCEEDYYDVANSDPGRALLECPIDQIFDEYRCVWDNSCKISIICGDSKSPGCSASSCTYEYARQDCDASGYMNVTYTPGTCQTDFDGDGIVDNWCVDGNVTGNMTDYCLSNYNTDCPGGTKMIPCGGSNFELGFFEYAHFLIAMIIISVVYLGICWGREKKK
jgi:hypothetical protein